MKLEITRHNCVTATAILGTVVALGSVVSIIPLAIDLSLRLIYNENYHKLFGDCTDDKCPPSEALLPQECQIYKRVCGADYPLNTWRRDDSLYPENMNPAQAYAKYHSVFVFNETIAIAVLAGVLTTACIALCYYNRFKKLAEENKADDKQIEMAAQV